MSMEELHVPADHQPAAPGYPGYFNANVVPKRVSSGPTRTRRRVPAWIRAQFFSVVKILDKRVEGYDPAGE